MGGSILIFCNQPGAESAVEYSPKPLMRKSVGETPRQRCRPSNMVSWGKICYNVWFVDFPWVGVGQTCLNRIIQVEYRWFLRFS